MSDGDERRVHAYRGARPPPRGFEYVQLIRIANGSAALRPAIPIPTARTRLPAWSSDSDSDSDGLQEAGMGSLGFFICQTARRHFKFVLIG